ncbi:MAG: efflux RND transporter periplasmic adaptor subunit [Spirochaetales bacterium]|nr:efflux RND transporter periplasmic adaptor subunit [Spirochaetales bacterium]
MKKMFPVLLLILLISCGGESADTETAASGWEVSAKVPVPVYTAPAVEEPFIAGLEASGIVEGAREAEVLSETSGLITAVNFEIGEYVESGDVLLKVEDRIPRISYESALRDFEAARIEFEALEKSFSTGGTSQLLYSQGRARLESARLRMEQARKSLEDTAVKAPFSGYISSRDPSIAVGSSIQPSAGVTHIADLSSYRIRISLGEDEISLVNPGDEAVVRVNALPGVDFPAMVRAVSPGSRTGGGRFPVLVSWSTENGESLKSGMSATVMIRPEYAGPPDLIIPAEALVRRDAQDYVFRIRDNGAEAVPVRILKSLGNRVSIAPVRGSDLLVEPGDQLIVTGLASMAPGDPVVPTPLGEDGQ